MGLDISKLVAKFGSASTALTAVNSALDVLPAVVEAGTVTLKKGRDVWDSLYETIGGLGGASGTRGSFDQAMAEFTALSEADDQLSEQLLGGDSNET